MALPEYMRIRQYVIDLMRKHSERSAPIMSERELCAKFDVTRPTARRALKELVDEGYLTPKPGLGTFINPHCDYDAMAALRKTYTVLVVFGSGRHTDLDGFCMDILARICDRLKRLPIFLRIANLNKAERSMALEELRMYNPHGVLWVRPDKASSALIPAIQKDIPVQLLGSIADGIKRHTTMDYHKCGRLAAEWFLSRSRQNVLLVGEAPQSPIMATVRDGWLEEFAAQGVQMREEFMVPMSPGIIDKLKALLGEGSIVDGVFSFGSALTTLDHVLSKSNLSTDQCPVLIDENYSDIYGISTKPAAKLMMFPHELTELAAINLFKMLIDPSFAPDEIVLTPWISEKDEMAEAEPKPSTKQRHTRERR